MEGDQYDESAKDDIRLLPQASPAAGRAAHLLFVTKSTHTERHHCGKALPHTV